MKYLWKTNVFVQCGIAVFLLFFGGGAVAFDLTVPGDQDASLQDPHGAGYPPPPMSRDFNGDGLNDLLVPYERNSLGGLFICLGGRSWNKIDALTDRAQFEIKLPVPYTSDSSPLLADLDGDHKQDILFHLQGWPGAGSTENIQIVRGRDSVPNNVIDLSVSPSDLVLNFPEGGAWGLPVVGDFNGDGFSDLALARPLAQPLGRSGAGAVTIFFGRSPLPTGTIDVQSDPHTSTLIGKTNQQLGTSLFADDLDQDGITDLVVSNHIFFGTTTFPATWDLAVTSADVQIQGSPQWALVVQPIGDMNGDHKSEFLVKRSAGFPSLLDGRAYVLGQSLIELNPGSPDYVPIVPIQFLLAPTWNDMTRGDFDGDGLSDLFFSQATLAYGILSSDLGTGPLQAVVIPSVTLHLRDGHKAMLKDINGDGNDEFGSYEKFDNPLPPSYISGVTHIVFGFSHLKNPSIKINSRGSPSLRVTVTLEVSGQPTEMMILGDLSDSFKGQWIPFQPTLPVTLTPAPGEKTVQAKFRNSVLRESELARDTWDLNLEPGRITAITNRFNPDSGQKASFECHLETPSGVHVTVHDTNGRIVREIIQGDQPTGIFALEWDGANNDGRRVVPGVYYLVININGRVERKKIVVRG